MAVIALAFCSVVPDGFPQDAKPRPGTTEEKSNVNGVENQKAVGETESLQKMNHIELHTWASLPLQGGVQHILKQSLVMRPLNRVYPWHQRIFLP